MTDNRTPTVRIQMYEEYDAFGVEGYSNRSVDQTFKYAGEQRDDRTFDTGYVYLRSRYYDASIGRFLTRDSNFGKAMDPLTLNRYSYVENNCPNKADPTGFSSSKDAQDCASGNVPEEQIADGNIIEKGLTELKAHFDEEDKIKAQIHIHGVDPADTASIVKQSLDLINDAKSTGTYNQMMAQLKKDGIQCMRFQGKVWDVSARGNVLYGYAMKRIGYSLSDAKRIGDLFAAWDHGNPSDDPDDQAQIEAGYNWR